MAQGSGSANNALALGLLLISFLLSNQLAESACYTVGDTSGWSFGAVGWPSGKTFKAGDVLVFKYSLMSHDVVAVSAAGYKSCKAKKGSKVYKSGSDRVKLRRGVNYFICSFPGHCEAGMKIAVRAA